MSCITFLSKYIYVAIFYFIFNGSQKFIEHSVLTVGPCPEVTLSDKEQWMSFPDSGSDIVHPPLRFCFGNPCSHKLPGASIYWKCIRLRSEKKMILKSLYEWSLFGHYLDWILWSPWTSKIGIQKAGGPLFSWWWDTYTLIRMLELRTSSELHVGNSITSHLFRQACEITCFKFCSVERICFASIYSYGAPILLENAQTFSTTQ